MRHIVPGGFSSNGLQKVFFSFHHDDLCQMKKVAKDVLGIVNCAVYYHEECPPYDEIDFEDYALKLGEMKLFVIVVTTKYLTSDSLSKKLGVWVCYTK